VHHTGDLDRGKGISDVGDSPDMRISLTPANSEAYYSRKKIEPTAIGWAARIRFV